MNSVAVGEPLRVAAFTSGSNDPSSRFRVRQYIGPLRQMGIEILDFPNRCGRYPPPRMRGRPAWMAAALANRMRAVLAARGRSDVTMIQREMVSTLKTFEGWTPTPRALDIDDAIFLNQRWRSVDRLASDCDLVICGNDYLAEHFRSHRNVSVVPTVVDTDRYIPPRNPVVGRDVIGWMGTSSNLHELASLETSLTTVLDRCDGAVLRIISDRPPRFERIDPGRVEFVRWTPDDEVNQLHGFTIGIMPLKPTEWAKGKCGYKLLTYLACGVASLASPVGVNAEILGEDHALLPSSSRDWEEALVHLLLDVDARDAHALAGRDRVVASYSLTSAAPRLAGLLRSLT